MSVTTLYKVLIIGLTMVLSSCGFQLRGNIDIPPEWQQLRLVSPSPNGELAREVRDGFSNNGVQWVEDNSANYILRLADERFQQRNLTIGSNARATEFELTLDTTLQVMDAAGEEVMPPSQVTVTRVMTHDPENVAGKVEESRLLRDEMRIDLVQQLLRKIRFAAVNSGTVTTAPATATATP
ncbi:hypothetical protein EYC98_15800 [Halieaceae bacterium IMCC14734]|uniref:LPS-assembly lipoprotein LptE n=1 Tax=Candidatus Litorirhabdus singularis TaxID=2518993 RepID=A0ABT3TJ40_9GAMM|nr:LPS assembly lipoprotein LptE [Candidatus Litorirhabdus singularis]MCX2982327.1 hypothetical protein [Candidatus Litorirhabdus singularis]